jgi:hypothetical protein
MLQCQTNRAMRPPRGMPRPSPLRGLEQVPEFVGDKAARSEYTKQGMVRSERSRGEPYGWRRRKRRRGTAGRSNQKGY